MSLDQKYIDFYLNSRSDDVYIETVEFSHSAFSKSFFLVRNVVDGITLKLEDGREQFFEYLPLNIRDKSANGSLDFGTGIDLGDLGELIPQEIDRIDTADMRHIKPTLVRRDYRYSTLEMIRFERLAIPALNRSYEGASVEGGAPALNSTVVGLRQTVERIPMLVQYT